MTNPKDENDPGAGAAPSPKPAPRSGVLAGIIRTAKATSTQITPIDASMKARTCRTCGAGRPEGTDLAVCGYCGDRFMTQDVDEAVDGEGQAGQDPVDGE